MPEQRKATSVDAALTDWHPSDATVGMCVAYQRTLIKLCVKKMGTAVDAATAARVGSGVWSTPAVATAVHGGGPAESDHEALNALHAIADAPQNPPPTDWCAADESPLWVRQGLAALDREFATAGKPAQLVPSRAPGTDAIGSEVEAILKEVWPEIAAEVHAQIRAIVFADGEALLSASTVPTFGAVYVSSGLRHSLLSLSESVVHESAHHCLTVMLSFDRMLTNSNHLATSPLRPDSRPLSGVLHACFVMVRQIQLLRLIQQHRDDMAPGVSRRLEMWLPKLRDGLATLSAHAQPTPRGAELIATLGCAYRDLSD